MLKFEFKLNGKTVDPRHLEDALMAAALESVSQQLRQRIGSIRDPDTGEFPTLVVSGKSLEELHVKVEGSARLRELVTARLELETSHDDSRLPPARSVPRVFLSYASENRPLAEHIAKLLMDSGIDTWWDGWEIAAGDSIRRRVDEGLSDCTHFLVLLTPESIHTPWVLEEIDAGFMLKVNHQARFIALRHDLEAGQLPPLLRTSASPALGDPPDLQQLISDIHGLSRKPALGKPPGAMDERVAADSGYSPAANAVARVYVQASKYGRKFDPQLSKQELAERTGLSAEDLADALHELSHCIEVEGRRPPVVLTELFVQFDEFWMGWNPQDDALELASRMLNDPGFPADPRLIDQLLGWGPRRLNPAMAFLMDRRLVQFRQSFVGPPYICAHMRKDEDETRRFVKRKTL
jgi:hypothetical protein